MPITSVVCDGLLDWCFDGDSSGGHGTQIGVGLCTGEPGDSYTTTNNELSSGIYATRKLAASPWVSALLSDGAEYQHNGATISYAPTGIDTITHWVLANSTTPGAGHGFRQQLGSSLTTASGVNFYWRDRRLKIKLTGNFFSQSSALGFLKELVTFDAGNTERVLWGTATHYIGLSETVPNADGTNVTELVGNGYARVSWNYLAADTYGDASAIGLQGRYAANSTARTYPTATADWNAVSGWFVTTTASGAGTYSAMGPLDSTVTVRSGETPFFDFKELACAVY